MSGRSAGFLLEIRPICRPCSKTILNPFFFFFSFFSFGWLVPAFLCNSLYLWTPWYYHLLKGSTPRNTAENLPHWHSLARLVGFTDRESDFSRGNRTQRLQMDRFRPSKQGFGGAGASAVRLLLPLHRTSAAAGNPTRGFRAEKGRTSCQGSVDLPLRWI